MKCRSYANDPSAKQYSFVVRRGIRLGMQLADGETYERKTTTKLSSSFWTSCGRKLFLEIDAT